MSQSRRRAVPERLRWAVQQLDLSPDDHVLEIGCGPGVAMSLICDQLEHGRIVGIDRSATAIRRAAARNADHVAAGTAQLLQVELAALTLPGERFDVIFAVNVNLFWVRPAALELRRLRALLREGGALCLCYEAPDPSRAADIAARVVAALEAEGYATDSTAGGASSVFIRATAPTGTTPPVQRS